MSTTTNTTQVNNLVNLLDGYATKGGHHLNVNVMNRDTLLRRIILNLQFASADMRLTLSSLLPNSRLMLSAELSTKVSKARRKKGQPLTAALFVSYSTYIL